MTFGKIHDSIFGSSIMEEDLEIRYVFMCMIAIADKEGFVDLTVESLARKFNIPVNIVNNAIDIFLKPDKTSRSDIEDGRRLRKIRESFGWQIINYEHYRNIRDNEDRARYMREYMKNYRKECKQKSLRKLNIKTGKQVLANTDTDTDKDILSQLLLDLILARRPNFKKPDIKKWAENIDLMIRIDKREPEEIENVIKWCQGDDFWQDNILSTFKLRKQFDQLALKATKNQINQNEDSTMKCKKCGDSGQYVSIDEDGLCALCRGKEYDAENI